MELSELVGLKQFSGCDFSTGVIDSYGEDKQTNCINFILDGVTYTALEDDNDGYRSAMNEVRVSDAALGNSFPPVQVMCVMRQDEYKTFDILDCYDVRNGKRVLSVGTDYNDSYYPSFVSDFTPENMHINDEAQS